MRRVAFVCVQRVLRQVLAEIAATGWVELETRAEAVDAELQEALRRVKHTGDQAAGGQPKLARGLPEIAALERDRRWDLLAGEVELERRAAAVVRRGSFAVAAGWTAQERLEELSARLGEVGGAVIPLPTPKWLEPPTMLPVPRGSDQFHALVETYGTANYRDIDPTPFAATSFILMFGMMFGDVGDGLILALIGLLLRFVPIRRLAGLRRVWALPVAAGLAAAFFGLLYGEAFGPTGLVPALWLRPLQDPVRLLAAGVGVGAALLAISYVIGSVNRVRESGFLSALFASSGIAGSIMFVGACLLAGGWLLSQRVLLLAGAGLGAAGVLLVFSGLVLHSGRTPTGILQAVIELVDSVVRLGANAASFARLAAFGMVHAAIGDVVWQATKGLWAPGLVALAAIAVFVAGHVLAFALEALVAAIQALRLEYYELFSKIFATEGRPFKPWYLELTEEAV